MSRTRQYLGDGWALGGSAIDLVRDQPAPGPLLRATVSGKRLHRLRRRLLEFDHEDEVEKGRLP